MVKFFKRYLTLLIIIPINIGAVMNSDIQISNYKFIGEQIVNTATKYIGVKYRYGHSSPNGFDCSGLTQYVYNKHGIKISRTAKNQYKQGEKVKKNELQSGADPASYKQRFPETRKRCGCGCDRPERILCDRRERFCIEG